MQCINCNSTRLKYDNGTDAYVCLDCGHVYPKEYWFISHSHLDIEKVRVVRNVIEEIFFYEPILFFLKCLSNDNEVTDLIHREIYERIWFVYCQSKNAEASKYVQDERKYLDGLIEQGCVKNKIEIDLDQYEHWEDMCAEDIRRQVFCKIRKDRIFLSYSRHDAPVAHYVREYLQVRGYTVYGLEGNAFGLSDWKASVDTAIQRHINLDGVFLLIVSEDSLKSAYALKELETAIKNPAYVIPVILNDGKSSEKALYDHMINIEPRLSKCNYLSFDVNEPEQSCASLKRLLKFFYYLDKRD